MDDFLVAGPADNPEEAIALMRATAIASFGEAVRQIARENFRYCRLHQRAVPRLDEPRAPAESSLPVEPQAIDVPHLNPEACICPPEGGQAPATHAPTGPV